MNEMVNMKLLKTIGIMIGSTAFAGLIGGIIGFSVINGVIGAVIFGILMGVVYNQIIQNKLLAY